MLARIRIEVSDEDSAAATSEALDKYEHALQVTEAQRCLDRDGYPSAFRHWKTDIVERDFFNEEFGREVTDEVIEYDPSLPGYKGRRVVQFRRVDTRSPRLTEPSTEGGTNSSISFAAYPKQAA